MLLPLTGENSAIGKAMLDAGYLCLFQHKNNNISIQVIDTNLPTKTQESEIQQYIHEKKSIILGPIFAQETKFISKILHDTKIPILSFSNDTSLIKDQVFLLGHLPESILKKVN
jgi:ABC-type branched-subunit amino acid transport system substrate-binding protein